MTMTTLSQPLDLRTRARTPDCRGRVPNGELTVPSSPPRRVSTSPALTGAPPDTGRRRPDAADRRTLPFRKRFPAGAEAHRQTCAPPARTHDASPAEDRELTGPIVRFTAVANTDLERDSPVPQRTEIPDYIYMCPVPVFDNYCSSMAPVYMSYPAPRPAYQQDIVALATHQDEDGDTALHIGVVQGKEDYIRELSRSMRLGRLNLNMYNNLRQTPLHLAVITHQVGMVKSLLDVGADPSTLDRHGQTALHLSCEHAQGGQAQGGQAQGRQAQVDCLSLLLAHCSQATLELRNFEGLTPLHLAVQGGHRDLAQMLLEAGADINAMDTKSGQSPLMHAVESNNMDMVHFLIESGSNVNGQSYSSNTALHGASGRGQVDIVRLLLRSGADCSLKNYHNDTALMVARSKQIADVLRGKGSRQARSHEHQLSAHSCRVNASGSSSPSL